MKDAGVTAALVFVLTSPAFADLTLKQTITAKGPEVSRPSAATTYIKGDKMRMDVHTGDRVQTSIVDVGERRMYIFDSKKKEADVWELASLASELSNSIDAQSLKASLTPNGQTKSIAGQQATGYDLEISVPAVVRDGKQTSVLVTLSGPAWIVTNVPGVDDYVRFYTVAAEKGSILSDPRTARDQPGQARAMIEMYRQLAEAGGIVYETDIRFRMTVSAGGNSPIGEMLERLRNSISTSTVVESVETTPLADNLFAPPAGYTLNPRK